MKHTRTAIFVVSVFAAMFLLILPAGAQSRPLPEHYGFTDWPGVIESVATYVHAVEAAQIEAAISDQLAQVAAFVAAARAAEAARTVRPTQRAAPSSGSGYLSDERLIALARCESGTDLIANPNATGGWRTGLYGIMDPAAGQMSRADQDAYARRIYAQHGGGAWGCPV